MKLSKAEYETRQEKRKDFFIGVGLFILINVLLLGIEIGAGYLQSVLPNMNGSGIFTIFFYVFNIVALLVNIGFLVFFGLTRYWIALGMLATFAGLLTLACLAGVVFFVACLFTIPSI